MSNTSLYIGKDFWSLLTAREPYVRRQKRLFERGVISEITEDVVAVCVGRREDGSEILLEEVPVVSGYNPQVGDWVVIRYDAGHGGAPMVFGPSVSDGSEEDPSTSSAEVVAARNSARYGAHASLDARLEEHEQDGTDPHGAALTQTSKVRTPLVDAAGNLALVPGAGYQVTVGDTGSGGVFRPVVIADQAYQTRTMQEVLLAAAAPAITADAWLGNLTFYPVNTDNTKSIVGLVSQLTFTGTNLAKASSSGAFAAQLVLNGSGAFPAASSHPTPVMDCNAVLGASFSGSIAALAGITPHLIYTAGGTGTVADYYGVYVRGDVAVASKVTNFTGLYLPAAPSNITNYYPIQIGGGTILGNGAVTWAAASDLAPLAIQGASGQTADLQRWQNSTPTVLAKITAAGVLGIDHIAELTGSHGVLFDNKIGILEGGASPSKYTIFQGGDQAADITYILPTANTTGFLKNTAGVWSWESTAPATAHNLLSATHGDTTADSAEFGAIIVGGLGPNWKKLAGNATSDHMFLRSYKPGANPLTDWAALTQGDLPSTAFLINGSSSVAGAVDLTGATVLTFGGRNQMAALGLGAAADATIPLIATTSASTNLIRVYQTGASSASLGASIGVCSDDGAAMASGDRLGFYAFQGAYNASHAAYAPAILSGYTTEAWAVGSAGSKICVEVAPNGSATRAVKLTVDQDGSIIAPQVYATTVTSSRDVEVDSTGKLGYVSSSLEDKENVRDLSDVSFLAGLRPVVYDRKDGSAVNEIGLIAEEVAAVFPDAVSYRREVVGRIRDDEGNILQEIYRLTEKPETVNHKRLIVPLLLEVQRLRKELEAVKAAVK